MDNGGPPHSQNLREKDSEKVPIFHWLTGAPVVFAASVIFEKEVHFKTISASFAGPKPWKIFIVDKTTSRVWLFRWLPCRKRNLFFRFCKVFTGSGKWKSGSPNIPNWQYIPHIPLIYHLSRWCPSLLLRLLFTPFLNRLVYELHHFDQLSGAFIRMVFLGGWRKEPEIQRPKIKNLPLSPWEKGTKRKILPSKFVQKWQALSKSSYMFIWFFLQTPHHKKSWKYVHFVFLRTGAILQTYGLSHYHPSSCSTRPPHCGGS